MSLDTLLEAAKFLESSSSKGTSKDDSAIARVHHSTQICTERRRAISECEKFEGVLGRRPGGAGTRETHNKLEKNRRAHLKECFDILKKEVPSLEDKKTSNLNILRSALKHIQVLKKRERDYEAERDHLKTTNNSIKQRLLALRKEVGFQQELAKTSQQNGISCMSSQPPADATIDAKVNLQSVESQASPVSVATQTSFTSGEEERSPLESDTNNARASRVNMTNAGDQHIGMVDDSVEVKKELLVDDEDEDVDVEGEVTDDNTEDVDALIKTEGRKNSSEEMAEEPKATAGRSTKKKAVEGDDGNKLDAKKSNIQCCARISC